jgi:hypothetical protein
LIHLPASEKISGPESALKLSRRKREWQRLHKETPRIFLAF